MAEWKRRIRETKLNGRRSRKERNVRGIKALIEEEVVIEAEWETWNVKGSHARTKRS